jgi:lambda repressor-like predicted transcriptional regulator
MKDYYATLRIQQGRLKAAMQELGIETVAGLSRRSGVSQASIGNLMNFRESPRTKSGEWRVVTLAICKALGSEPSELFPEHLDHEITTNRIASFVEHAQISGGTAPQHGRAKPGVLAIMRWAGPLSPPPLPTP